MMIKGLYENIDNLFHTNIVYVWSSFDNPVPTPYMVFVESPGGCGKTFLTNILLSKIRSQGLIALAVASSGIAATLMSGGRTAHSHFFFQGWGSEFLIVLHT